MRIFAAVLIVLTVAGTTSAGEALEPETLLPVHDERDAYTPAAAFGPSTGSGQGGVYLVAWQSGRIGEGDLTKGIVPIADLVACRVDKAGKVLDEKPFVICGAKDFQEQPQIAFAPSPNSGQGEGVFLVVWQDLRNEKDWDVYAARVSPGGKVLDPDGILVAGGAHNQALPRLAWDGKTFWVVWQDFRSGGYYEIYGGRVSPEGKVLDGQGVLLASGAKANHHCYYPATASAGAGKSFVLWVLKGDSVVYYKTPDSCGLFVADGKPAGEPLSYKEKGHGPAGNANPVALAAGSDTYLAVWRTDYTAGRGGSPAGSTAALFDAEGKRTKSLFLAAQPRIDAPEVCWDGSAFVAAWQENGAGRGQCPFDKVLAARISPTGELAGAVHAVSGELKSPAREAAVAADGTGTTLIAYEKHPETANMPIWIGFRMLSAK